MCLEAGRGSKSGSVIKNARVKVRKLWALRAKIFTVTVWKIEIAMNGQLVGFLVRGKFTHDENFYKVLGREARIIAPIDLATKSGQFPAPTFL